MKIKMSTSGLKPFKANAAKREQKQPAKPSGKARGQVAASKAKQHATPKPAGRVLGQDEAEKIFAKLFLEFCKELPQFAAGDNRQKLTAIDSDRANAWARRFLANRRIALCRKG